MARQHQYTRLNNCKVCPFKNVDLMNDDPESGMEILIQEGKGVWTCAQHLWAKDKKFRPQCKSAMKTYTKMGGKIERAI